MKWLNRLLGIDEIRYRVCAECKVLFAPTENLKYDYWCAAHRDAQVERMELENWGLSWVKRNLDKIKELKRQEEAERNKNNQAYFEQLAKSQAVVQSAQFGVGMQARAYEPNKISGL